MSAAPLAAVGAAARLAGTVAARAATTAVRGAVRGATHTAKQWKRDLHRVQREAERFKEKENEGGFDLAGKLTAKAEKAIVGKIREGTATALQQSWVNIIDSFGLTYIYIIFHYVMAYLGGPFSRFFPRAGREWIMKNLRKTPMPEKTKEWTIETMGAVIEPFELILFFLVLGLLFFIFLVFAIIIFALTHPCQVLEMFRGEFGFMGWIGRLLCKIVE